MSIKGNFSDISFAELLKIISKYNGRLGVWNFQEKKQYECFLQNETVVYININGQNVLDADTVNSFLTELSSDKQSYYAFQKDVLLDSKPQISLDVSKILSTALLSNAKLEDLEQQLPNILTKFEISKEFSGNLPEDLEAFWNLSITHLHMGCSASELANFFGMKLKEVQLNFYRLRTIGAIKPVRLFKVNSAAIKAKSAGSNLQRIVGMRNGVKPSPPAANNFPPNVPVNQQPSGVPVNQPSNAPINQPPYVPVNQDSKPVLVNETQTLDNFELDNVIQIPNNEHFVSKYSPSVSNDNEEAEKMDSSKEIVNNENVNNNAVQNKKPIFNVNSDLVKPGIVRRMLSSLFSRKTH